MKRLLFGGNHRQGLFRRHRNCDYHSIDFEQHNSIQRILKTMRS